LEERASVHLTARREFLGVSTCIISCLPLRRCPTLSLDDSDSTATISLPILYTHMATGQKEKKKHYPS
jgi:hypothetical protein